MIFIGALLHAHNDIAVHLDEAAITIPGKAFVLCRTRQGDDGLVVEAEVEDGIHHPRHGIASTGTDGDEHGHFGFVAELCPHYFFDLGDCRLHLCGEDLRVRLLVAVVVGADLRGDGEAWRNGEPDAAHFGKARAFASEESAPGTLALCFTCTK